ncbi:MAG: MMPL family transporter [Marinobacter sp.]|uniref:efflux RND transporter permease subunit n=1 Tax=Marinobacter sp. TaxID=50741 RepID=UPI00299D8693|nr:MMPL family transporter [Marinobacter sp.]MDX1633495.1 MMPL family transporter [Marinobacter sp.]
MSSVASLYRRVVLDYPALILIGFALLLILASLRLDQFRLDASAESLVLEDDKALEQYRMVNRRFTTSDDFLVVTYTPSSELFSQQAIDTLRSLRDDLAALEAVGSTNSILNVPLLQDPELTLENVESKIRTLDSHDVALDTAREALLNNPLYPNLLIGENGQTTAIQVNLPTPERYFDLLQRRNELRDMADAGSLDQDQQAELARVSQAFIDLKEKLVERQDQTIAEVRAILDNYRDSAEIHLGGVPMIVADMINFIESDLSTFGIGVLLFMILVLAVIFRQWQWVVVPLLCCFFTVWLVTGYLSWIDWPVTVISSNYVSLLLIMTLSLTIHLIVRYREFQHEKPDASARELMADTVRTMVKPCFYMAVTTIVAFGSLTFSGIRPVIDFGWMMTLGLALAFIIAFVVFPALLVLVPPPASNLPADEGRAFTRRFADFTERFGTTVLVASGVLAVLCVVGISRLSVENSFIDYFKEDTEIYQGMVTIDRKLGGTSPLDVVITDEPPPEDAGGDPFASGCDPFLEDCEGGDEYRDTWFTPAKIERLEQVHDYLDSLSATGKTLSIVTTVRLLEQINQGQPLNAVQLAFVPAALPDQLDEILLSPYIAEEHDQARFSLRLIDSLPELNRDELLERIHNHLTGELGYPEDRVMLTGMTVMYNNMLQSLFDSQIKTLGLVFLAIAVMFLILFRSLKLALIGIAPNLLAAGSVLGLMGWLAIPLDLMTITVAAITVGIAVDDTIHYIHRFRVEFQRDGDYLATMHRCHQSIGRAMFYTSLTIILGFSILVLSNFIPTIYFGLFTGFAMLVALLGALTLLPRLILLIRPFGPDRSRQQAT